MQSEAIHSDRSFQLCRLIGRLRGEFVNGLEHELAAQGLELNFSQFLALKLLGASAAPMAPGELARALHYNPGAMTRLLDKLERLGYLKRVPDPSDRRVLRLQLTSSGRAIRKRVAECSSVVAERLFACVAAKDKASLHAILSRVLERAQASRESSGAG